MHRRSHRQAAVVFAESILTPDGPTPYPRTECYNALGCHTESEGHRLSCVDRYP